MKALQLMKYGEIKDSLAINEVDKPSIQSKDVLIEVKAAAINPIVGNYKKHIKTYQFGNFLLYLHY